MSVTASQLNKLSLFVLQTSQMCLLFLHHELRVLSKVGGSVGQHGTRLLEFLDLKRTWQSVFFFFFFFVLFGEMSWTVVSCKLLFSTSPVPLQALV